MNVIISSSTSGMVMMLRVLIAHTYAFVRSDFDKFLTRKLVYSSDAAAIKAAKIKRVNFQRCWLYWYGFIYGLYLQISAKIHNSPRMDVKSNQRHLGSK